MSLHSPEKTPTIFLDLDDCLIHSLFGASNNKHRKRINLGLTEDGRKDIYSSLLRDSAHTILSRSRAIAPTKLLTTATKDYALEHNEVFSLGFDPSEVIAREDFLVETSTAYGGRTRTVTSVKQSPQSVLIDNMAPSQEAAELKRIHLGIPVTQYFQIREFYGASDPANFERELNEMFEKISSIFKEIRGKIEQSPQKPWTTTPYQSL